MKVYIGHDAREDEAAHVAAKTLLRTSGITAEYIKQSRMRESGLFTRPQDTRNRTWDLTSSAFQSTEFSLTRFLVPILCQEQWALFTDCDVVFLEDAHHIMDFADPSKAVLVVQHEHHPKLQRKMDDQQQTSYPRKNWSSVVLWNCYHPANARLSLNDVNNRTGLYLHRFGWLNDNEIGELPARWNWLVNEQPKPDDVALAHFTNGGSWIPGWQPQPHDEIWNDAFMSTR